MGAILANRDPNLASNTKLNYDQHPIIEQIQGVIKVFKDGSVERTPVTQSVTPMLPQYLNVAARDVFIDVATNIWARIYVPMRSNVNCYNKLPLLVYFHGGGFCVGSTAWKCYHDFLGNLSSQINCIIVSVNYRLAPENRLPAAYEDGINSVMWVKQLADDGKSREYWAKYCDFSKIFLSGDSAGANIAYNVALKLDTSQIKPLEIKGIIMIQPFFGGELRTLSEKSKLSKFNSAVSDKYWRLALPEGENRDHPWCNPLVKIEKLKDDMKVMVCVAEEDILRDRNIEVCLELSNAGNVVQYVVSEGVGHAFQVVDDSELAQVKTQEMISHIVAFVNV